MIKVKGSAAFQTAGAKSAAREGSYFNDIKLLVKGIVLVLNVLPVFTGFMLALYFGNHSLLEYWPAFILTMAGSTLVMAGALIMNNWYEADLDEKMVRTMQRPTVTGNIPMHVIFWMGIGSSAAGFLLLMFTTWETVLYAFVGWFVYVVLYTFWSKRRYTLNTVIGSVSGAVTPMIGWAAVDSAMHIIPVMIFLILFLWQIPHTFAIAIRRFDDYKAAGVPMLPVVYGFNMTKRQMLIYIACLLPMPFYMSALGIGFVVFATLLNVAWLGVSIAGFFTKDDVKWANIMFRSSLIYLTALFLAMLIVTVI